MIPGRIGREKLRPIPGFSTAGSIMGLGKDTVH